jgi:hypothetical protein
MPQHMMLHIVPITPFILQKATNLVIAVFLLFYFYK